MNSFLKSLLYAAGIVVPLYLILFGYLAYAWHDSQFDFESILSKKVYKITLYENIEIILSSKTNVGLFEDSFSVKIPEPEKHWITEWYYNDWCTWEAWLHPTWMRCNA